MASAVQTRKSIQFEGHSLPVDTALRWRLFGSTTVSVLVNRREGQGYLEYEICLGTAEKVANLIRQIGGLGIKYELSGNMEKMCREGDFIGFAFKADRVAPELTACGQFAMVARLLGLNVTNESENSCVIQTSPERLETLIYGNVVAKEFGVVADRCMELADIGKTYGTMGISSTKGEIDQMRFPTQQTAEASLILKFEGEGPAVVQSRYAGHQVEGRSLSDDEIRRMI